MINISKQKSWVNDSEDENGTISYRILMRIPLQCNLQGEVHDERTRLQLQRVWVNTHMSNPIPSVYKWCCSLSGSDRYYALLCCYCLAYYSKTSIILTAALQTQSEPSRPHTLLLLYVRVRIYIYVYIVNCTVVGSYNFGVQSFRPENKRNQNHHHLGSHILYLCIHIYVIETNNNSAVKMG